ncbi:hypothetical protein [Arthrobacter sp. fls2-241-R2A-200]|uniref:hypothetical protein n=1 Tax=Arthrobacter sp. fls2-241-R2A-200 TaxID=3040281 RepID=UPI002550693F|nr:hypothetical protein [Arthrobacter sp. fls2-241-R2A-200]
MSVLAAMHEHDARAGAVAVDPDCVTVNDSFHVVRSARADLERRRPFPRSKRRARHFRAVVSTVPAAGSLVLVGLDLVIGWPAAGNVFITDLNALAAFLLWRKVSEDAGA